MSIHPTAKAYESVETTNNYVKARPSYPAEVLEFAKSLNLQKDSLVVDLAAGTGKFTELLVEPAGFRNIVAVEPSKEFRDACVEGLESFKLGDQLQYKVVDGLASQIPLPDASVDALFIAQAFHWFDNLDSVREISRVLKRGGVLFMVWNSMDITVPFVDRLNSIYHHKYFDGKTPQYRDNTWRNVFEDIKKMSEQERSGLVDPNLNFKYFDNDTKSSKELVIQRVLSTSYISILPPDRKEQVIKEVSELVDTDPHTKGKESFVLPYKVELVWTRKL